MNCKSKSDRRLQIGDKVSVHRWAPSWIAGCKGVIVDEADYPFHWWVETDSDGGGAVLESEIQAVGFARAKQLARSILPHPLDRRG